MRIYSFYRLFFFFAIEIAAVAAAAANGRIEKLCAWNYCWPNKNHSKIPEKERKKMRKQTFF